jgi:hypothetical protein
VQPLQGRRIIGTVVHDDGALCGNEMQLSDA